MQDRLLRRREVEELTGLSRASIYRKLPDGEFPRPVKVGSTAVRWKESDITAWIESRPVATDERTRLERRRRIRKSKRCG